MERERFDALTRIAALRGSRRAALAALAGALVAGSAAAKGKGRHGHHGPPGSGRRCAADDDCPDAGDVCCDGRCSDVSRDRDHCGVCTARCAESEVCRAGACVDRSVCDVCDKGRSQCPYGSVQEAIDAAKPNDFIHICPGSYKERVRIGKNLTLLGMGDRPQDVELDGQNRSGQTAVLTVDPNAAVSVRNLKITGGRTNNAQAGGGVTNFGRLFLVQVHITDNDATRFNGGGILNAGADARLDLDGCKVSKNQAANGGGVSNQQGAVNVNVSQIDHNEAGSGGGLHTRGGTVDCQSGVDVANNAAQAGGGIQIDGGRVTLHGFVFVTHNKAAAIGGGINNFGTLVLSGAENDIADNRADDGGGIYNAGTMSVSGRQTLFGNDPNDCVNREGGMGCPA